jgi:hypothetical protein
MLPISMRHRIECVRCGSGLVTLEWHERVNANEVQNHWHCWNCKHQFVSIITSDERVPLVDEITKPFFTSLLV